MVFASTNYVEPGRVAKLRENSPNDRLLQGPDWTTPLIEFLCSFLMSKAAIDANVREIILQTKVSDKNRNGFGFLWRAEDATDEPVV